MKGLLYFILGAALIVFLGYLFLKNTGQFVPNNVTLTLR